MNFIKNMFNNINMCKVTSVYLQRYVKKKKKKDTRKFYKIYACNKVKAMFGVVYL